MWSRKFSIFMISFYKRDYVQALTYLCFTFLDSQILNCKSIKGMSTRRMQISHKLFYHQTWPVNK